jgi:serpin B
MKQIALLLSLALSLLLFSCENKGIDDKEVSDVTDSTKTEGPYTSKPIYINLTRNEKSMTNDITNFAMKYFSAVNDNSEGKENIVISPFGTSMALAILRNGAEGETKQAITEAMGMKDFPEAEINAYFRRLKDSLTATDPSLSLAIANSIWYKKDAFTVKRDFENLSKTWYDAPVTGLDHSNMKAAVETVNRWCSDNMNGLIKDMLKDLKEVDILNALYFKGAWTKDYEFDASETTKDDFTLSDGSKVKVDMMHSSLESEECYSDEYLSVIALPYGNTAYSIYFVVPNSHKTFEEMTKQFLVPGYWSQCARRPRSLSLDIYIPKFEAQYENENLNKVFEQLGIGIAFSPAEAQFPHIANTNFYVARSQTKSYLKVDEKGTEAAATVHFGTNTLLDLDGYIPPDTKHAVFRADRPFLFVIQEFTTGAILFMGKIGDPTEK